MSEYFSLIVERMPSGGFVITDGTYRFDRSTLAMQLFACTTIGEAMSFVASKLDPSQQGKGISAGIGLVDFAKSGGPREPMTADGKPTTTDLPRGHP